MTLQGEALSIHEANIGWAFGCSRRGASHRRIKMPCQDAYSIWSGSVSASSCLVAAVADGHGDERHDLSHYGASLAVKAAVDELLSFYIHFGLEGTQLSLKNNFKIDFPRRINRLWREYVLKDAEDRKITNLFNWNEIPGNDNPRLIEFLKQNFGTNWIETANIEKTDDGKTIILSDGKNSLSFRLNIEKTEVSLITNDGRTDKFNVKTEHGKLSIYKTSNNLDDNYKIFTRYGTTLLTALIASNVVFIGQIGDGDILLIRPNRRIEHIFQKDNTLVGTSTYSLSSLDTQKLWQVATMERGEGGVLLMATDGLINTFADDVQFQKFVNSLLDRIKEFGIQEVTASIPHWLDSYSENGSGDDITLVLVYINPEDIQKTDERISPEIQFNEKLPVKETNKNSNLIEKGFLLAKNFTMKEVNRCPSK